MMNEEKKLDLNFKTYFLRLYYENKNLSIIGLNDSQGINVTTKFWKKGLLDYIASALTDEDINPTVINAFSLLMNKTEHIDYMLKNNISLEDIKLSQVYSAVSAFEKVMKDVKLPKFFGKVGNAYKLVYRPKQGDKNIHITDVIKGSEEPLVIYSSGVNNLMREVGNDPFNIKGDYKNRHKRPNYNYTLEKAKDEKSLQIVMDGIKRNFEHILSLNLNTDIYALGAYIPKALEADGMNVFRELVLKYNELLQHLCKSYNLDYVNTELIGKKYNKNDINFHIDGLGHNALAAEILKKLYEKKLEKKEDISAFVKQDFEITNDGVDGMIFDLGNDRRDSIIKSLYEKDAYARKRQMDILNEHKREQQVFAKVKTKTK